MGIDGFLGNLDAMYNETDTETPQWQGFLETWHDILGDKAVTSAELVSHINENAELRSALPDTIADIEAHNNSVRLGQSLAKRSAVRYPNGFVLIKAGEKKRAVTWQVVRFENETSPKISFKGEVGEVHTTPARENKLDNNSYKEGVAITSPNLTLASKMGEVVNNNTPDYPTHPCFNCRCGDYWLREAGQWGKAEWLCSRCHPKPGGGNG